MKLVNTVIMSIGYVLSSTNAQMLGAQQDSHGCVLDGGYQWCESQNKCVKYV